MNTVVTTAGRTNKEFILKAKEISINLNLPYYERKKKSVSTIQNEQQANVLVVNKERLELYTYGSTSPFFFHPNSAAFRIKRLLQGEQDSFLESVRLEKGDCFLDTTAGLCSDSIIASYAVGDLGVVHACEKERMIAYMVDEGLRNYETRNEALLKSMRHIDLIHQNAVDYMKTVASNFYDVVYLDPMFEEVIEESSNFQVLRAVGAHDSLTDEWVEEAKRLARKRVVLKAHFRSNLFDKFGFEREIRLSSKFHYGIIELL
ncbi:Putative SAM-dependent methyltransferase [Psychrobacillus sp. OK028]|uniref:class I SAM-dependent methyltransferase n=1 Tax=Psychrobacillus sp. OK028 TaxID=1884359 RepID=UPI00088A6A6E|nr:class I SAM-dependent methyltransferase [Psychrobacillus sp. OK028]SDN06700.1 Putative SAM-dependent methyltransferase [Psychrobacillus sp. OK028]